MNMKKKRPRGRPPKAPHEKRVLLTVSVDPRHYAWIEFQRKARKIGRSKFVKELIAEAMRQETV